MPALMLPQPVDRYFASKSEASTEDVLGCFISEATVWDNGEDLELRGIDAIRSWMTSSISEYDLTTEPQAVTEQDGRIVVRAHVAGNFPGSPYAFDYRFLLRDGQIAELAIDPVGPVAN
jgi:hypothetical protein